MLFKLVHECSASPLFCRANVLLSSHAIFHGQANVREGLCQYIIFNYISRGFVKYKRAKCQYRDAKVRLKDWDEIYNHTGVKKGLQKQAARCMDCGVPFCQSDNGCPLGNIIPKWNDLVFRVSGEGLVFCNQKSYRKNPDSRTICCNYPNI